MTQPADKSEINKAFDALKKTIEQSDEGPASHKNLRRTALALMKLTEVTTIPLYRRVKALEQISLINAVPLAEKGTPYPQGSLVLDTQQRLWVAVEDDPGTDGPLQEPTWRLLSGRSEEPEEA